MVKQKEELTTAMHSEFSVTEAQDAIHRAQSAAKATIMGWGDKESNIASYDISAELYDSQYAILTKDKDVR